MEIEYHVYIHNGCCFQFDNEEDAVSFATIHKEAEKMSKAAIIAAFGDAVCHVGPHNTSVNTDGIITFDYVPIIPTTEDARSKKQLEITTKADGFLKALEPEYCDMERQTWDQQYAEAVAYKANTETDVPMLTAIAANRGMEVNVLADNVIANKTAWATLAGSVVGQRLAYQDSLEATATTAEIEAIEVNYVIA